MNRREFLHIGLQSAAVGCISSGMGNADEPGDRVPLSQRICLFTDHLDDQGYSFADVAKMLTPLKIAGPDLTVRGGGIVPPARVADELPRMAAALRDQGMSIPMITTTLTSAEDPTARPIFEAMAKLGIRYYKLGYYNYGDLAQWESELKGHRKKLAGLVALGLESQCIGGFHNHAGGVGGAIWDAWELLEPLDAASVGFYFDPAHASIEGAKQAWKLNFQRIAPRVKMMALKDYVWEKTSSGWRTRWCPLGEGMVNWPEFFALLVKVPFPGLISTHIEYDPGGSTKLERIDRNLEAAQRDVDFVRKQLDGWQP